MVNDCGQCGWPPLSIALLGGDANISIIRLLIRCRAQLDLAPSTVGHIGMTPLLQSAVTRQETCLRELLDAGAQPTPYEFADRTLLGYCAQWSPDHKAMRACKLLIGAGADATARDRLGRIDAFACAVDDGNAVTATLIYEQACEQQAMAQSALLGDR